VDNIHMDDTKLGWEVNNRIDCGDNIWN